MRSPTSRLRPRPPTGPPPPPRPRRPEDPAERPSRLRAALPPSPPSRRSPSQSPPLKLAQPGQGQASPRTAQAELLRVSFRRRATFSSYALRPDDFADKLDGDLTQHSPVVSIGLLFPTHVKRVITICHHVEAGDRAESLDQRLHEVESRQRVSRAL